MSSKTRRIFAIAICILIAVLIVFHDGRYVLALDRLMAGAPTFLELFLLITTILLCVGILFRHVRSPEYLYMRTLPVTAGLRLTATISAMLPSIAFYLVAAILICDQYHWRLVCEVFYKILLVISAATLMAYLISLSKGIYAKSVVVRYCAAAVGVACIIGIIIVISHGDGLLLMQALHFTRTFILSANAYVAVICLIWLFALKRTDHTFYAMSYQGSMVRRRPLRSIYKGVYCNLVYKDFHVAVSKISFIGFLFFYTVVGVALLFEHVMPTVYIVALFLFQFLMSFITEELMKDDVENVTFLRTLPIKLNTFFTMKIFAVYTVLTMPSILYWFIVCTVSGFSVLLFLSVLAILCVFSYLLCAMQCVVVFANLNTPHRTSMEMMVSLCLSGLVPIIPLYYVTIRARQAKKIFCGGRQ